MSAIIFLFFVNPVTLAIAAGMIQGWNDPIIVDCNGEVEYA
jgi:hypothetical protein